MEKGVKVLIVILCLIIVGLVAFIVVDKFIVQNLEENATVDKISTSNSMGNLANQNNQNNQVIDKNRESNNNNTTNNIIDNTTKNERSELNKSNEYTVAISEIKKYLKDDEWIKNNVSLENGNEYPDNEPQKYTFIVVKNSSNFPIIVIKAQRQSGTGTMQAFVVTYRDKKVVSTEVASGYRIASLFDDETDIKVDPNNALVNYYSDLGGGCENMIYNISNGESKELDIYGYYEGGEHEGTWYFKEPFWRGVSTISEQEYNSIKSKYQSYNFYAISTELTDENIDKYVK